MTPSLPSDVLLLSLADRARHATRGDVGIVLAGAQHQVSRPHRATLAGRTTAPDGVVRGCRAGQTAAGSGSAIVRPSLPASTSKVMLSPSRVWPASTRRASWSSIVVWISRRSGRAP